MGTKKERLELERNLANYQALAREFPDGEIALVIRDFIEELSGQSAQSRPSQLVAVAGMSVPATPTRKTSSRRHFGHLKLSRLKPKAAGSFCGGASDIGHAPHCGHFTRTCSGERRMLTHALMNVIASRAFERSDVKAGRAGRDPCQHRHRLALRTWWSVERAQDAVPYIRREHKALSHR